MYISGCVLRYRSAVEDPSGEEPGSKTLTTLITGTAARRRNATPRNICSSGTPIRYSIHLHDERAQPRGRPCQLAEDTKGHFPEQIQAAPGSSPRPTSPSTEALAKDITSTPSPPSPNPHHSCWKKKKKKTRKKEGASNQK